jgi:uncharacterized protein (TIGR03437 family)
MRKNKQFLIAKTVLVLAAVPFLIYAYEFGPPPGYTGAPGDNKTGCIASGCHTGTVNSGPGNVKILLPNGSAPTTYTPGQAMTLLVQITDSTKGAYGFQLTARSGSNGMTQAGDFTTTDANTQVFCPDDSMKANGSLCNSAFPTQYIEHTMSGYTSSMGGKGSYSYSFTWTPPSAAVGNISLYVAANAGLAGPPVVSPTNVYLNASSPLVLTPTAGGGSVPSISKNGVVPVFSSATTIQPTSWISIYGANLATTTALWTGNFPTTLGNASVTVNGKPGYLYYASPTQINLQAPSDTATGSVNVVVTTPSGSTTSTVTLGQYGPSFSLLDATHVAGIILRSNGSGAYGGGTYDIVGPTGTSLGYKTVAAKAGDSLVLFGVGFGPTNPVVAAAAQPPAAGAPITAILTMLMNNKTVTPAFSGLTSAGLYQFNITVPAGLGTGDVPLSAMVGGVTSPSGVVVSLQ